MSKQTGTFYIVAAPSGAGKTSLVKAIATEVESIQISISHTTRPPRPGDVDGKDYHFIDKAQFEKMISEQLFLEHAEVFGRLYGTSKAWVMEQLENGIDVILEIDWQGARQIRQLFPSAVSIFIMPPSIPVLRERLSHRAQDNAEVIDQRMQAAHSEMSHYHEFDYLVVNDDFVQAVQDLKHIISSQRLLTVNQTEKLSPLLAELLQTQ